jgi:type I restriction enzyme, R subunit
LAAGGKDFVYMNILGIAVYEMTNEAFSRVKIDAQLKDEGWETSEFNSVRFEYVLPDGTKADYVLRDRNGRSLPDVESRQH